MTRTPPGTPVISLEGVRKSRGDFELGPLDLRIEPGQVVAVVGPNSSGKSTLFEMLMNLLTPSSGEIQIFGCSYPEDEVQIKRPARLISNAPRKTAEALIASNIPVMDESSVSLEEILFHLVRRSIAGA
jgi:ABC-type multidrug transport system ATPase subunit